MSNRKLKMPHAPTKSPSAIKRVARKSVKPSATGRMPAEVGRSFVLAYHRKQGVDAYVKQVRDANPVQIIEIERQGIASTFIVDLSKRMDLPSSRMYAMLRIPSATAARKSAAGAVIDGRAGLATMGMIKLLGIAQDIVQDSTSPEAEGFDTAKWLGQWIERPQPALGGQKPADFLDTPTGVEMVAQVLGAVRSGAYL
jgi:putative toxin-antitoxin system antitoxin component (TIGR02293 family)